MKWAVRGESSSSGEQWGRKTAHGHQRVHHGVNAAPPHLPEAIGKGLKLLVESSVQRGIQVHRLN